MFFQQALNSDKHCKHLIHRTLIYIRLLLTTVMRFMFSLINYCENTNADTLSPLLCTEQLLYLTRVRDAKTVVI